MSILDLLSGGSGASILDSTANLAAEKLASGLPVSSEPPADAFDYFNNDFFNQNRSGILGTDEAQNIVSATPMFASEDIAARNVGVPQDNRFTGIMRNIARGPLFQGGATAGLKLGEIITGGLSLPFALAGGIVSQFLPLGRSKPDMDYQYVNQPGGVNVVDNKITTGVLAGKNFESAFGSANLGEMYQNYIDNLEEEDELTDFQQSKLDQAKAELNAYLTTGAKIRGYRDSVRGRTMTPREFAFNYNQGIGQFAMPTQDSTGKTLDYTGESDTYAGGETTTTVNGQDITTYNDPYDPDDSYAP